MSKAAYIGVSSKARKVKKMYIGVDGIARKVKKGYVGVKCVYTELDYIESTGTQYIDTGVIANQDTKLDMVTGTVSVVNAAASDGFIPYGSAVSNNDDAFECYVWDGELQVNYADQDAFIGTAVAGHRLHIVHDKNSVSIEDETSGTTWTHAFTYDAFTAPCDIRLCALKREPAVVFRGKVRIYSCQIYDNGTLVRDYVPCKDNSGDIGLWDKVEAKFYANAGSGVFTAGAEKGTLATKSVAKLFFTPSTEVIYTGTHTITQIDVDGVTYNLLTATGSGTLTVDGGGVQAWICGGGSSGCPVASSYNGSANGGGGAYAASAEIDTGTYAVVIGAGGSKTSGLGYSGNAGSSTTITDANGTVRCTAGGGPANLYGNGGSGGGAGRAAGTTYTNGKGDGKSKYPFGIESLTAHCAGGGGGACCSSSAAQKGGDGGSNGGNGAYAPSGYVDATTIGVIVMTGGEGGTNGGGQGGGVGNGCVTDGKNATFYGSGGGGAACEVSWDIASNGGAGYQGVMYALWAA